MPNLEEKLPVELMQPLIGAGSNGIDDTFRHPTSPTTNSSLELLPSGVDLVLSNGVTSASIRSVFPDANGALSSNLLMGCSLRGGTFCLTIWLMVQTTA